MSSILDLFSPLKLAFRDSLVGIENELLSREEKWKHEIEKQSQEIAEQQREIDKLRSYNEKQRKEFEELEEQLEFVRLDKIRIEQDLKEKCKDNECYRKLLKKMKSRVPAAEEELVNFKSMKASFENGAKEVKTEVDVIDHNVLPRSKGNGKPLSEEIVVILDSDEDGGQREMNVKKIPEILSMDDLHFDQTVSETESGVLKRKQALAADEGNGNGDSHDRNEVVVDKSSDDRHKRVKVEEISPINNLPETTKSPERGLRQELEVNDVSDSSEGSSSSDDTVEDLISDPKFKTIFISKENTNIDQKKGNGLAERKAALEKDEAIRMRTVRDFSARRRIRRSRGFDKDKILELRIAGGKLKPSSLANRWAWKIATSQVDNNAHKWKFASQDSKNQWFELWKEHFHWDSTLPGMSDKEVQHVWERQVGRRYNDNVGKLAKSGIVPKWIQPDVWSRWLAFRRTPEAQAESKRQSANRRKNPVLHTGGSISHEEHRERMEQDYGRIVTPYEVFAWTHTRADERSQFVDQHAADITVHTQNKLSQMSTPSGTQCSYQDKGKTHLQVIGTAGPVGSVIGADTTTSHSFLKQIDQSCKEAARTVQISSENTIILNDIDRLRSEFSDFQSHMKLFMAEMTAKQSAPSSSRSSLAD